MDAVDRKLIEALRGNARASYAELGRLVGLSGPSVADRLGRLEHQGVITGYRALIAPLALGLGVTALVGLQLAGTAEHDEVAERLREVREIEDCWFTAGEDSYMIKVRVADVDALERTVRRLARIDGITRTRTTVVLSTTWEGRPSELPEEKPEG